MREVIPFNRPYMTGREPGYIAEAHANGHLAGDGPFTKRCHAWLEERTGCNKALLTHSCTAALEMGALLAGIGPGDEVIMPSFTFVSSANAFVLRGGVPVFVDIRPDTFNLDERRIEAAITPRTKAIVPVHYAGVGCEMDEIMRIAERHGLIVIEDAAQGMLASYRGRPLGAIGHLGCLSFHETKNIHCGEGGALLINDARFGERAEIIREKGTNRSRFFRGQVDKYTWVDVGSSYLPSDVLAAFLWAQMEQAETITARRLEIWRRYHEALEPLEAEGRVARPVVPPHVRANAHLYSLLLPSLAARTAVLAQLRKANVHAVFHYVSLHDSPAGREHGRVSGSMAHTTATSERLIRLPLWLGLEPHLDDVIGEILSAVRDHTEAAPAATRSRAIRS
jgi:dTDP-4-amino-4,6-dideoxygalactose transaminase